MGGEILFTPPYPTKQMIEGFKGKKFTKDEKKTCSFPPFEAEAAHLPLFILNGPSNAV